MTTKTMTETTTSEVSHLVFVDGSLESSWLDEVSAKIHLTRVERILGTASEVLLVSAEQWPDGRKEAA